MGSGFQAWAQDGSNVVQIDGDAGIPNLQLMAKYDLVTTTPWITAGVTSSLTDAISLAGLVDPVIAVRCTAGYATVMYATASECKIIANGAPGIPVTVYVFARPTASGSNHFQVLSASGQLVFDAGRPAMRVRGQYTTTALGAVATLPAGPTYAAVVTAGWSRTVQNAGPSQWLAYALRAGANFAGASANELQLIGVLFEYTPPTGSPPTSVAMNQAQILVLDVTGL